MFDNGNLFAHECLRMTVTASGGRALVSAKGLRRGFETVAGVQKHELVVTAWTRPVNPAYGTPETGDFWTPTSTPVSASRRRSVDRDTPRAVATALSP